MSGTVFSNLSGDLEAKMVMAIDHIIPGLPPYKKQGNHRKSYMVIYEKSLEVP